MDSGSSSTCFQTLGVVLFARTTRSTRLIQAHACQERKSRPRVSWDGFGLVPRPESNNSLKSSIFKEYNTTSQ